MITGRSVLERSFFVLGDAIEVMRTMDTDSVGAIVTSPPYNIGIDYGAGNDKLDREAYSKFTRAWIAEALRIAPVAVINFGAPTSEPMRLAEFMLDASEVAVVQQHIVWAKAVSTDTLSVGHFKPVNSKRYITNVHESVFIVSRDGSYALDRLAVGVPFKDKSNINRFSSNKGDVRCRGNVWLVPYPTTTKGLQHPATYPVALARMMLQIVGTPATVCDPFVGTGTTLIAAEELGASGIGIDLKDWMRGTE